MILYDKLIYPLHTRLRNNPKFLLGCFLAIFIVGFIAIIFNNMIREEYSFYLIIDSLVQTFRLIILETEPPNKLLDNTSAIQRRLYPIFLFAYYLSQIILPFLAFYGLLDGLSKLQKPSDIKRIFRIFYKGNKLEEILIFIGDDKFSNGFISNLKNGNKKEKNVRILVFSKNQSSLFKNNEVNNIYVLSFECLDYFMTLLSSMNQKNFLSQTLYIDGGSDDWNYQTLKQILGSANLIFLKNTKVLVHIENQDYEQEIYRLSPEIISFSLNRTSARLLLGKFPPVKYRNKGSPPVHILLAGFGSLGYSLLQQIILTCHYFDHAPVKITIVDEFAKNIQSEIEKRWPVLAKNAANDAGFSQIYPVATLNYLAVLPEMLTLSDFTSIVKKDTYENKKEVFPIDISYVLGDNKIKNLAISRRLQQIRLCLEEELLNQKIIICGDYDNELSSIPDLLYFNPIAGIFNSFSTGATNYPGQDLDKMGKIIHDGYQTEDTKNNLWQPFERSSSNASADHLWIKLRAFQHNYMSNPEDLDTSLDYFEKIPKDFLSKLELAINNEDFMSKQAHSEHRRFCAERVMDGWLYSQAKTSKYLKSFRINSSLVNYNSLDSTNLNKTRESFIHALSALKEWNSRNSL